MGITEALEVKRGVDDASATHRVCNGHSQTPCSRLHSMKTVVSFLLLRIGWLQAGAVALVSQQLGAVSSDA